MSCAIKVLEIWGYTNFNCFCSIICSFPSVIALLRMPNNCYSCPMPVSGQIHTLPHSLYRFWKSRETSSLYNLVHRACDNSWWSLYRLVVYLHGSQQMFPAAREILLLLIFKTFTKHDLKTKNQHFLQQTKYCAYAVTIYGSLYNKRAQTDIHVM